ncbi:MAG: 16S rRNA processing protein RimM [Clostridia bacterium]|nr:16S rRNA processing protein RimM [Clostridia bacterium]
MTEFFELGRVLKPQGIKGEIKAELYTDDPGRVSDLEAVYFEEDGAYVPVAVRRARTDGRCGFLFLEGVHDRDQAEKLRGRTFFIDRAHAAPLPEGAYYISDLVGLPVFLDGRQLGSLGEILQTGTKDIYVVELEDGGRLMFPAVEDVFAERDIAGRRIVLNADRLEEIGIYDL